MIGAKFTDPQFVDANGVGGLNAAFGAVSGSIALLAAAGFVKPGLYQPELMTVAFSGLTATVGLPAPFAVINASGVVAQAHGTATGSDTQNYTVSFSGLVPGSGSIVAYCVAQAAIVQQNPVPIPGPPPGHPSYNPNYQPTIGYAQAVDTLALSTTTTPPDGMSTFELFRTTLTAGEGSITSRSTEYQQRTTPYWAAAPTVVAGGNLTFAQSQGMLVPASGGITSTLPLAASGTGLRYSCLNTSTGTWTIAAQGSDRIYGSPSGNASGVISFAVPPQGAGELWSSGAEWLLKTFNPTLIPWGAPPTIGGVTPGIVNCITGVSGNQAVNVSQFPSSLGSSGYKKYPDPNSASGYYIEQFGSADSYSNETNNYDFPIEFPSAVGCTLATIGYVLESGFFYSLGATPYSLSGFSVTLVASDTTGTLHGFAWTTNGW